MTASDDEMIWRRDALKVADEEMRRYGFGLPGGRAEQMRDAIAAIPAVQVEVKPLEWKWSDRVQGWRADCELTRDVFIAYQTNEKWSAGSQWFGTTYHQTEADAKSHLDQMRAARIRSALTAQPSPEYSLAPHLKRIVDGAKTAPQWDTAHDRLTAQPSPDVAALVAENEALRAEVAELQEEVGRLRMAVLWPAPKEGDQDALRSIPAAQPSPDVAALVEALTIAANRLQRLAVEFDAGTRMFFEASEWADEARAVLARVKGGE